MHENPRTVTEIQADVEGFLSNMDGAHASHIAFCFHEMVQAHLRQIQVVLEEGQRMRVEAEVSRNFATRFNIQ